MGNPEDTEKTRRLSEEIKTIIDNKSSLKGLISQFYEWDKGKGDKRHWNGGVIQFAFQPPPKWGWINDCPWYLSLYGNNNFQYIIFFFSLLKQKSIKNSIENENIETLRKFILEDEKTAEDFSASVKNWEKEHGWDNLTKLHCYISTPTKVSFTLANQTPSISITKTDMEIRVSELNHKRLKNFISNMFDMIDKNVIPRWFGLGLNLADFAHYEPKKLAIVAGDFLESTIPLYKLFYEKDKSALNLFGKDESSLVSTQKGLALEVALEVIDKEDESKIEIIQGKEYFVMESLLDKAMVILKRRGITPPKNFESEFINELDRISKERGYEKDDTLSLYKTSQ